MYRIAEYAGKLLETIHEDRREFFSKPDHICPFDQKLCNKKDHVCTLVDHYNSKLDELFVLQTTYELHTICPRRFLQDDVITTCIKLFMEEIAPHRDIKVKSEAPLSIIDGSNVKIDYLFHSLPIDIFDEMPRTLLAVETQACYFSGDAMGVEISFLKESNELLPAPKGKRTPDIQSATKRLTYQIKEKHVLLKQTGDNAKIIVVVDKNFMKQQRMKNIKTTTTLIDSDLIFIAISYEKTNDKISLNVNVCIMTTVAEFDEKIFDVKLDFHAYTKMINS